MVRIEGSGLLLQTEQETTLKLHGFACTRIISAENSEDAIERALDLVQKQLREECGENAIDNCIIEPYETISLPENCSSESDPSGFTFFPIDE